MGQFRTVVRHTIAVWWRNPAVVVASLAAPLGLAVIVGVLTIAVGRQPVAMVVADRGPLAAHMAALVREDAEAYALKTTDLRHARAMLRDQQVAGIIVIPPDFDRMVTVDGARITLELNNVDIDFADDLRRAVRRSAAQFDAPDLGILGELRPDKATFVLPNPYRVDVAEVDLRPENVSFQRYQLVPVLALLVINVALLGTALLATRETEIGTRRLVALAPVRTSRLMAARLTGASLATLAVIAPVVAIGAAVGWVAPVATHWLPVVALIGSLTVMSAGLGLLLGGWHRRTRSVTMTSVLLATYLFFLGGGFTTIAFLPEWIQTASRFAPTSYAIHGLRQALFYRGLDGVGTDLAALAGCAVAATAVAGLAERRRAVRA